MGGWIATEIAHILSNEGEEIKFIGLFDPPLIVKPNFREKESMG